MFQAYLFTFCTISLGLLVQCRYLLANLKKIYVYDRCKHVNINHYTSLNTTKHIFIKPSIIGLPRQSLYTLNP